MKSAWETRQLNEREGREVREAVGAGGDDGGDGTAECSSCCCPGWGPFCKIFLKYTVGRSLQLGLYILDIATDVGVAYSDYQNGDPIFASITLGLVFAPGFLFALFGFMEVLTSHTGILACVKAPLWLLSFPFLPLWPVVRDLHQIFHGVMALFPSKREHHLAYLNKPSRAYLLKFLEAFAEAAPQILLQLYKITLRRQEMPFSQVGTLEVVQITFSLVSLANKIISTHQKSISTAQIISGEMEDNQRFKLPCIIQIIAFLWWVGFLLARFEAMALFAGSLNWWIFVVIGIHVVLVFLFQTVAFHKHRMRRIIIYIFSAFVFIFAYLQFNMKSRIRVTPWFPYTVYSILVLVENSIMLVLWYLTQENATAHFPEEDRQTFTFHRQLLIYFHYGAFSFAMFMMILTFCCAPRQNQNDEKEEEEMRAVRVS